MQFTRYIQPKIRIKYLARKKISRQLINSLSLSKVIDSKWAKHPAHFGKSINKLELKLALKFFVIFDLQIYE